MGGKSARVCACGKAAAQLGEAGGWRRAACIVCENCVSYVCECMHVSVCECREWRNWPPHHPHHHHRHQASSAGASTM